VKALGVVDDLGSRAGAIKDVSHASAMFRS
jgi:hypothetical protein